MIIQQPVF